LYDSSNFIWKCLKLCDSKEQHNQYQWLIQKSEVQKAKKSYRVPDQNDKKMDKDDLQHCFSYLWHCIIVVCVYKSLWTGTQIYLKHCGLVPRFTYSLTNFTASQTGQTNRKKWHITKICDFLNVEKHIMKINNFSKNLWTSSQHSTVW